MRPHSEIQWLLRILDEAYDRKAWHGPTLRGSIRGVTNQQADWRPARARHNIWEIVLHAAYWKYAVRRRLLGGKRGSFHLDGSNWFECPASPSEKVWRAHVALLEQEHRRLRQAVAQLSHRTLHKRVGGKKTTSADTILGIAFHDVYHAGQIQLLKRQQKVGTRDG